MSTQNQLVAHFIYEYSQSEHLHWALAVTPELLGISLENRLPIQILLLLASQKLIWIFIVLRVHKDHRFGRRLLSVLSPLSGPKTATK